MVIPTLKQLYKFYSMTEKSLLFSVKAAEHFENIWEIRCHYY